MRMLVHNNKVFSDQVLILARDLAMVTTNDGSVPFAASLVKSGQAVDWDMGNGTDIEDTNSISYSGYIDTSEKTVTVRGVDNFLNITEFQAEDSQIKSVTNLKSLKSLTSLKLSNNNLTAISVNLLTQLEILELNDNQLTTLNINNLTNLITINVADNNISGTLISTGDQSNLEYAYIQENNFSGPLPDISVLTNLVVFSAHENSFSGSLPSLPASLTSFSAYKNSLTGTIPTLHEGLNYYYVYRNSLTGTIPALPTTIKSVSFQENNLSGDIPDITGLTDAQHLRFEDNQLTGYGGGLDVATPDRYYAHENLLPSSVLNDIINDIYTNRVALSCDVRIQDNDGGVDQISFYKIKGYGGYDGIEDNGSTVLYDIEYDDSTLVKFTTTKNGTFNPTVTSSETHVWDLDTEIQETNTPSVTYPDTSEKTIRILASDYGNLTRLYLNDQAITSFPTNTDLLTNLEFLYIYNNSNLNGPIPAELFKAGFRWFYGWSCNNVGGTVPSLLNAVDLQRLYIGSNNHIGELPSLENTDLERLRAGGNNFTSVDTTGLDTLNNLDEYQLQTNQLQSTTLNDIIDKLFTNRANIACEIQIQNNIGGVDQDGIFKIEGYGAYKDDGLIDNGCTVDYDVEFDDSTLIKITTEKDGDFTPEVTASEIAVWEDDEVFIEDNAPTIPVTNPTTLRFLVSDYTNVTRFKLQRLDVTDITNLSLMTNLEMLYINSNELDSFDITPFTGLRWFNISNNNLTELDLQDKDLVYLVCSNNNIGSLDVSNQVNLYRITANSCGLSSLDLTNNTALKQLELSSNSITSLSINHLTLLEELELNNNQLTALTVSALDKLNNFRIQDNLITDLNSIVDDLHGNAAALKANTCTIVMTGNAGAVTQEGMYKIEGYGGLTGLKPECTVLYDFVPNDTNVFMLTSNKTGDFSPVITSSETHVFYIEDTLYNTNSPVISFLTGDSKTIRLFALNDDYSNVTGLIFNSCGLIGAFPDLTEFSGLTNINFDSNSLTGDLPDLSAFTGLVTFYCSGNSLTGTVDLSPFTSLTNLKLRSNDFSGSLPVPAVTCSRYWVGSNEFTGELFDLTGYDFVNFEVQDNNIHTYNGGITDLLNISSFYLYTCQFDSASLNSVIDDFYTIRASVSPIVRIHNNPGGVDQTSLYKIEGYGTYSGDGLVDNGFTVNYDIDYDDNTLIKFTTEMSGTFDPSVTSSEVHVWDLDTEIQESNTPSVVYPDGTEKTIRLLASDYGNITRLEGDSLDLIGNIPENIILLTGIETLSLDKNDLDGTIPSLDTLTSLEVLTMKLNNLSGSIPSLDNNVNLVKLNLRDNVLTGSIPDLSNNTELTFIQLKANQLTGYSGGLDSCTKLENVSLYTNDLTRTTLNNIIDDLYTIRVDIGALSCAINVTNNAESLDQVAWYKIEGYGIYTGDGLKDNGCTVLYDISYNDTTLFKFNTNINGTFEARSSDSVETHLWDVNGTVYETNTPSVALTGSTVPVRLFASNNDYSTITDLRIRVMNASGAPNWDLFTGLKKIYVNSNSFTGNLPDITLMPDLEIFSCYAEDFSGDLVDPSSCPNLEVYKVYGNSLTGNIPDFSSNSSIRYIDVSRNDIEGYDGGLDSCVNLEFFSIYTNDIPTDDLNSIVDDLFTIRASIGANSCDIKLENNTGTLDADAIAKIEGTGAYVGDGLKDHGCTVTY